MKYFSNYDTYQNYTAINQDQVIMDELYEKNFFTWLIKSRKFGDLFSLRKVVKIAKRIAQIDYEYANMLKDFQQENANLNMPSGTITLDQADILKSLQEEKINLNKKIDHKYGDSEFLMYTKEAIINEEELKYIKRRRKEAKNSREKAKLKKLEKVTQGQSELLKQQVESSMPGEAGKQDAEVTTSISDVERHKGQLEKEKRDALINKMQAQKMRLQTGEAQARSNYLKNYYSTTGSGSYHPRNVPGKKASARTTKTGTTSGSKDSPLF